MRRVCGARIYLFTRYRTISRYSRFELPAVGGNGYPARTYRRFGLLHWVPDRSILFSSSRTLAQRALRRRYRTALGMSLVYHACAGLEHAQWKKIMVDPDTLPSRAERLRLRVAEAAKRCGRPPDAVSIIAVSKTVEVEAIRA